MSNISNEEREKKGLESLNQLKVKPIKKVKKESDDSIVLNKLKNNILDLIKEKHSMLSIYNSLYESGAYQAKYQTFRIHITKWKKEEKAIKRAKSKAEKEYEKEYLEGKEVFISTNNVEAQEKIKKGLYVAYLTRNEKRVLELRKEEIILSEEKNNLYVCAKITKNMKIAKEDSDKIAIDIELI